MANRSQPSRYKIIRVSVYQLMLLGGERLNTDRLEGLLRFCTL